VTRAYLLACPVALIAYVFLIRYALRWSRSRWDPEGDSRPLNDG
jgi:hypothetical protein